jgi:3-deoxy-7-phosphoheptulonate synthase
MMIIMRPGAPREQIDAVIAEVESHKLIAHPVLKKLTHLPVIIDPSHSTGDSAFVSAIARAGVAAGADGIIVEVHHDPAHAISDGKQSLTPEVFAKMVKQVKAVAEAVDRRLVN